MEFLASLHLLSGFCVVVEADVGDVYSHHQKVGQMLLHAPNLCYSSSLQGIGIYSAHSVGDGRQEGVG